MPSVMHVAEHQSWTETSYRVRVRGTSRQTFLWGSAGITQDQSFDKPPVLHLRNDPHGEPISLGTQATSGNTDLGVLEAGECISLSLQSLSGVFATCANESNVSCAIKV